MTKPDRMYEEELRRALRAAADLVMPAGDGLAKIRERTQQLRPYAWMLAYVTYPVRRLFVALRVTFSAIGAMIGGYPVAGHGMHSAGRHGTGPRGTWRTERWLRPAFAAAAAVLLITAVTLAIPRLSHVVNPASNSNPIAGSSGNGPGGGNADATGQQSGGNGSGSNGSGTGSTGKNGSSGKTKCGGADAKPRASHTATPSVGPATGLGSRPLIGTLPTSSSCSSRSHAAKPSSSASASAPLTNLTPTSGPSTSPTPTTTSPSPSPTGSTPSAPAGAGTESSAP